MSGLHISKDNNPDDSVNHVKINPLFVLPALGGSPMGRSS
jgi:hypothetical protein